MSAKNAMLCEFACLFVGSVTAATIATGKPKHDNKQDDDKKPAATACDHATQIGVDSKGKDHNKKDENNLTAGMGVPPNVSIVVAVSTPLKPASYRGNFGRGSGYATQRHCHRHFMS